MAKITLGQRPDEVVMHLVGKEYRTLMETLESAASGGVADSALQDRAYDLWERLLVEGGHIDPRELAEMRRARHERTRV